MYKLIRPNKDATVYGYAPLANAGIDEVLELNTRRRREFQSSGELLDSPAPSRILMEFPNIDEPLGGEKISQTGDGKNNQEFEGTDPRDDLQNRIGGGPPNAFSFFGEELAPIREKPKEKSSSSSPTKYNGTARLRLWFSNGQGLPRKYEIEAYPVQKEWVEGRGRIENVPPTVGPVNWEEANPSESWDVPGCDFDESVKAVEVFNRDDPDLYLDLDPVLSTNPENGILLKRKNENFERLTELKFFSLETRTIYIPHILLGVDQYQFDPESASPVESENFEAFVTNMQNYYQEDSKVRFEVAVREKYKQRRFLGIRPSERSKKIEGDRYLPERSLTYQIEDVRTGLNFLPFDKRYTAVSYKDGRHFFDVDFTNLLPKRKYNLKLRFEDPETGVTKVFDDSQTFLIQS